MSMRRGPQRDARRAPEQGLDGLDLRQEIARREVGLGERAGVGEIGLGHGPPRRSPVHG